MRTKIVYYDVGYFNISFVQNQLPICFSIALECSKVLEFRNWYVCVGRINIHIVKY